MEIVGRLKNAEGQFCKKQSFKLAGNDSLVLGVGAGGVPVQGAETQSYGGDYHIS